MVTTSLPPRFWAKVDKNGPGGCWLWTAYIDPQGYGRIGWEGVSERAHRLAYKALKGFLPDGRSVLVVDHLCRVRHCVNPDHLEAVPMALNTLRGEGTGAKFARRDFCSKGHPFTTENTRMARGARVCVLCDREYRRRYLKEWRAKNRDKTAMYWQRYITSHT